MLMNESWLDAISLKIRPEIEESHGPFRMENEKSEGLEHPEQGGVTVSTWLVKTRLRAEVPGGLAKKPGKL